MKLKYYLRGLGIGILLTTLILSFSKTKITDQEIINRAMGLGMVKKEDPKGNLDDVYAQLEKDKNSGADSLTDNQKDSNGTSSYEAEEPAITEGIVDNKEPSTTDEDIVDDTQNEPQSKDASSLGNTEPTNTEQGNTTVVERITFYIPEGMSSDRVARILEDVGVITDAHNFNEYVKSVGKTKKIRTGNFSLAANTPYEEILEVITKEGE